MSLNLSEDGLEIWNRDSTGLFHFPTGAKWWNHLGWEGPLEVRWSNTSHLPWQGPAQGRLLRPCPVWCLTPPQAEIHQPLCALTAGFLSPHWGCFPWYLIAISLVAACACCLCTHWNFRTFQGCLAVSGIPPKKISLDFTKQYFTLYFTFILVWFCLLRNHLSRVALEDTAGEVQLRKQSSTFLRHLRKKVRIIAVG